MSVHTDCFEWQRAYIAGQLKQYEAGPREFPPHIIEMMRLANELGFVVEAERTEHVRESGADPAWWKITISKYMRARKGIGQVTQAVSDVMFADGVDIPQTVLLIMVRQWLDGAVE